MPAPPSPRRSKCCANAWTSSAWPSRSSSRRATTASWSSCPACPPPTRRAPRSPFRKRPSWNSAWCSPTSDQDIKDGIVQPGYEILKRKERMRDGRERTEEVEVKKRAEMDGSGIKSAMVVRGNLGEPEIHFTLDSKGAERFAEITRENVAPAPGHHPGRRTLFRAGHPDAHRDRQRPDHRPVRQPAKPSSWPTSWRTRSAPRCRLIESREVDPTLGKDSIRSGINAAIYGTLAVSAFMLVYYLIAGVVANVALIANIIILLGVMCSVGTTLTLPGIAGIVLTIGMAVDANVLIYERIREETGQGQIAARRDRRRLRPGLRHHLRLQPHDADFLGHPDLHGHRPGQGLRRDAHHRCDRQHVHRAGRHPADLRLPAGPRLAQVAADAASHPGHQARLHEAGQACLRRLLALDRRRRWLTASIAARPPSAWISSAATPRSSPSSRRSDEAAVRAALDQGRHQRPAASSTRRT